MSRFGRALRRRQLDRDSLRFQVERLRRMIEEAEAALREKEKHRRTAPRWSTNRRVSRRRGSSEAEALGTSPELGESDSEDEDEDEDDEPFAVTGSGGKPNSNRPSQVSGER